MNREISPRAGSRAARARALALCLVLAPGLALAAEKRGGIEIGSKGVKMTVIELGEKPGDASKVVDTGIIDTTIASGAAKTGKFSPEAIQETAAAAGVFAKKLRGDMGLKPDQIVVVGSSGLPSAENRKDLVDAVKAATGLPAMDFITTEREIDLTIAGTVPRAEWESSALVDVGSGNTKGGLFTSDGGEEHLSLPVGSVTLVDRVAKQAPGKPFEEALGPLRTTMLDAPLAAQVKANPELAKRPTVFLVGGAATP